MNRTATQEPGTMNITGTLTLICDHITAADSDYLPIAHSDVWPVFDENRRLRYDLDMGEALDLVIDLQPANLPE